MSILDLFESPNHRNNIGHFAAIVHIAVVDGLVNEQEEKVINTFASALDITDDEYKDIMRNHSKYPLVPISQEKKRLRILYDLFKTVFSDNEVEDLEIKAIKMYAIGLGFPVDRAEEIIEKSIDIFSGKISFTNYKYLLDK